MGVTVFASVTLFPGHSQRDRWTLRATPVSALLE